VADPSATLNYKNILPSSYTANKDFLNSGNLTISIARLQYPTECFMLADGADNFAVKAPAGLSSLHFDGANIAFMDGHVKWWKHTNIPAYSSTTHFWVGTD
jgi:prepilin-type processing-associated H-X9-DG protein